MVQVGKSLGIASVPNLRDLSGYLTRDGDIVTPGLELLGVPRDTIMADYLGSNDTIIPRYQDAIAAFVQAGGDPDIPEAILGVQAVYLNASFDAMENQYSTIENYFAEGLGINADGQQALRDMYLGQQSD